MKFDGSGSVTSLIFLLECTLIEAPNVPSSPRNGLGHVHALFSARSCSMVLRGRKRLRALPNLSSSVIRSQTFVWDDGFPMGNGSSNH